MFKRLLLFLSILLFEPVAMAQWVYKTPSGAKYHTAQCHTVKNVSERINLASAHKNGLTPCKICKPPIGSGPVVGSGNKKPAGEGQTVQCRGTTKAGSRCKHKTSIGNGYCFLHQPT